MSSDSNQENNQQNKDINDEKKYNSNEANTNKQSLTFKDWKSLKESQNKANGKSQNKSNFKTKNFNKNTVHTNDNLNNYSNNGFNGFSAANEPDCSNFVAGNNGVPGFMPPYSFSNMNLNNNFGMRGNNCYGFNGPYNNFNRTNQNFGGNNGFNNFNGPNNFGNSNNFGSSNSFNSFANGRNRFHGPSESSINLPDNFFASDGIYRQKDFMQKPLPDNNPFRNDQKANQLLKEFDNSRYSKDNKKKNKGNKQPSEEMKTNLTTNHHQTTPENVEKLCKEPKVFVPNPKAKIDGKPYIPKPKVPEQNLEITKEEKKQQWKAYREAMKPFKNREFYNAKRVVQRLGKKDPSELDEKETIRLSNAREIMDAHKGRLTAKYANYIKAEECGNELGELYVLKKKTLNETDYRQPTSDQFQNYGNFGESCSYHEIEAGRKIVGGFTGFKGFVPGGMLEDTKNTQKFLYSTPQNKN